MMKMHELFLGSEKSEICPVCTRLSQILELLENIRTHL